MHEVVSYIGLLPRGNWKVVCDALGDNLLEALVNETPVEPRLVPHALVVSAVLAFDASLAEHTRRLAQNAARSMPSTATSKTKVWTTCLTHVKCVFHPLDLQSVLEAVRRVWPREAVTAFQQLVRSEADAMPQSQKALRISRYEWLHSQHDQAVRETVHVQATLFSMLLATVGQASLAAFWKVSQDALHHHATLEEHESTLIRMLKQILLDHETERAFVMYQAHLLCSTPASRHESLQAVTYFMECGSPSPVKYSAADVMMSFSCAPPIRT